MNLLLALSLLLPAAAKAEAPAASTTGWKLVWSDEFDGKHLSLPDPRKWGYAAGDDGYGNQELEDYCAGGSKAAPCDPKSPNAYLDGYGHLVIKAIKTKSGKWTSARLNTEKTKQVQYGRVEARMRLPSAAGLWPAFWLIGVSTEGWPACGEIDVMENVMADVPNGLGAGKVQATIHGPGYSGTQGIDKRFSFPDGGRVDDGYHEYGAIWSPGSVSFYVDDWTKPYFTASREDLPPGKAWVFDHPFTLIMNLAVGGSWPKDPNESTPNPAVMLVDYVRVYRLNP
ncbi:MAG TPA: glycoside hydrolase family 16 protein [Elusimicrobiota bacterium]|nr:glycoside hydrolase family 16 protein [Elusimicrobiota bacterium]